MDTPARTALSGGVIAALALGALATVGITQAVALAVIPGGAAKAVGATGAAPVRAASALTAFADCAALQAWYVDHTIDQVGPYGWGGRAWTTMAERLPGAAAGLVPGPAASGPAAGPAASGPAGGDSAEEGLANGSTGTNTQEAGIDEPDVAKTDGRIVVRLVDGRQVRQVVVTDVTGAVPRELSHWTLPAGSHADGLLLVGEHVLLAGDRPAVTQNFGGPIAADLTIDGFGSSGGTDLLDLDLSDPAHPRLDSRSSWSGRELSLRQYGDTVRLVTSTDLPALPFVQPLPGKRTEHQAELRNREIARASTVADWVPDFTSPERSGRLVGCNRVYHPKTWSGSETVAVATFRPGDADSASTVAVTGAGNDVYSSADRLYVTSRDSVTGGIERPMAEPRSPSSPLPSQAPRTLIHAFALDGSRTRYLASGSVAGTVRDRWSLDAHDGHLRVALTWPGRQGEANENGIVVLDERDGTLAPVGVLRGLGVGEEIQSVRWFEDLAVLVTFQQLDPLYTIDLGDPAHPRRLGELKIPGFSAYLHPIGDSRLLGLGTDATLDGRSLGAQAGVFDVADTADVRQLGKVGFGPETQLGVTEDPHAFTWLPGSSAAVTTLQSWDSLGPVDGGPSVVLLRVASSGSISASQLPSPGGRDPRALPLPHGRLALVGAEVRLVAVPLADAVPPAD